MDERAMVKWHLVEAEGHVALGERHITQQKEIVAQLELAGQTRAATTARDLLQTYLLTRHRMSITATCLWQS
jgi:hypothetical protein